MADFGPLGGVKITGFISPTDTEDSYAVTDPLYGIDGFRNITGDTSELNNIPENRRRAGMMVGVSGGTVYHKLKDVTWQYDATSVSGGTDWDIVNFDLLLPPISITADTYTTGVTLNDKTLVFNSNTELSAYSVNLSAITVSKFSITTGFTADATLTINHNFGLSGDEIFDINTQLKNITNNELIGGVIDNYQSNSVDITFSETLPSVRVSIKN